MVSTSLDNPPTICYIKQKEPAPHRPILKHKGEEKTMANPVVTIIMENGDVMKAELYPEVAPNTVNNFISLVKKGYYDGLIFTESSVDL